MKFWLVISLCSWCIYPMIRLQQLANDNGHNQLLPYILFHSRSYFTWKYFTMGKNMITISISFQENNRLIWSNESVLQIIDMLMTSCNLMNNKCHGKQMPKLQWLTTFPKHTRAHTHTCKMRTGFFGNLNGIIWKGLLKFQEIWVWCKYFAVVFLFIVYFIDICSRWAVLPGCLVVGQDFLLYSRGAHSIIQIL